MMKVKINFTPYYEWYAKWIDWKKVSVNDFVNGKIENPFSMLDEWLDIISIKPTQNDIGKEIYYSLNALQRNEITYDTYLEGCAFARPSEVRCAELTITGKHQKSANDIRYSISQYQVSAKTDNLTVTRINAVTVTSSRQHAMRKNTTIAKTMPVEPLF